MRIILYPQELIGGYCIFNCSDATDLESYGDPEGPGISISVIKGNLSDVANTFMVTPTSIDEDTDFEECFRKVILGEQAHWKIVRVVIDGRTVRLQFASEYYYKERNHEYMDYAELDANSLRAILRFEVPSLEGCDATIVDVSLSNTGPVEVTEYNRDKKRIFKFLRPQPGEYYNCPTIVTECM